ncbi:QacE family quaternary ammonium compound efflux SMR transporter [Allostella sp. ATCC 35155]|nr:QacE family quaternary ammonium compound efflux SMR transporter [Stella sp. ATCC 35155]
MTAWVLLVAAGVLEIVWAAALKASAGFSRPVPTAVGLATAALSLAMLSLALRSLPVSVAYPVWVGIGTAGVAIYGAVALAEPVGPMKILAIVLIGIGVAGLGGVEDRP